MSVPSRAVLGAIRGVLPSSTVWEWADMPVCRFTGQSGLADFVLGSVSFPDVLVPWGLGSLKHVS